MVWFQALIRTVFFLVTTGKYYRVRRVYLYRDGLAVEVGWWNGSFVWVKTFDGISHDEVWGIEEGIGLELDYVMLDGKKLEWTFS